MLVKMPRRNADESISVCEPNGHTLLAPSASLAMRAITSVLADIAATEIPVLLLGETGTGKEVVALTIHQLSRRREGPFIKIRCSSVKPGEFAELLPANGDGGGLST
ncbi:MAG: sigma 54-interacting transcriptional regulator, partial [Terriglobia bacterium]